MKRYLKSWLNFLTFGLPKVGLWTALQPTDAPWTWSHWEHRLLPGPPLSSPYAQMHSRHLNIILLQIKNKMPLFFGGLNTQMYCLVVDVQPETMYNTVSKKCMNFKKVFILNIFYLWLYHSLKLCQRLRTAHANHLLNMLHWGFQQIFLWSWVGGRVTPLPPRVCLDTLCHRDVVWPCQKRFLCLLHFINLFFNRNK